MKIFTASPQAAVTLSLSMTNVVVCALLAVLGVGGAIAVLVHTQQGSRARQAETGTLALAEQQTQISRRKHRQKHCLVGATPARESQGGSIALRRRLARCPTFLRRRLNCNGRMPSNCCRRSTYSARQSVQGQWAFDGRTLSVPQTGPWNRIALPYSPPEEYDFRIDFTRDKGALDICQIFSVDNANLVWRMNSANKPTCQFGALKDNPTVVAGIPYRPGLRCTAIVEVRRGTVSAYLNGKLLQTIATPNQFADAGPDWRLPDRKMLGLGTWFSGVTFQRIAVREVSGRGAPVSEDTFARDALNEAYWNGARDLMPLRVDNKNSRGGGQWKINGGKLSVVASDASRLQLAYKPPQEYDMRLVFTRTEGERNISHILVAGGRQFSWKIGAWDVVTLDHAGKFFLDSPSALHLPGHLENGIQHSSVVSVRKDRIRAYLDGKLLLNLATDYSNLELDPGWEHPISPTRWARVSVCRRWCLTKFR